MVQWQQWSLQASASFGLNEIPDKKSRASTNELCELHPSASQKGNVKRMRSDRIAPHQCAAPLFQLEVVLVGVAFASW